MKIAISLAIVLFLVTNCSCGFLDKLRIKIKFPIPKPKPTFGKPRDIPIYTLGIVTPTKSAPKVPEQEDPTKATSTSATTTPELGDSLKVTSSPTTTVPELGGPLIITTPPPPPPPQTPPEKNEDEGTLENCLINISECPWTIDELVEKIEELKKVDTDAEFSGNGNSKVGPIIDPDKVSTTVVSGTSEPGKPVSSAKTSFPQQCLPCCFKSTDTNQYNVDCIGYLNDDTLKWYYQRRNAMNGCFTCRNVCELQNAVRYL